MFLVVCGFAALGAVAWRSAAFPLADRAEYLLSVPRLVVPAAPAWIPDDFVRDVIQSAGLDRASLLDPDLPRKLSQAFQSAPWVHSVERVELRFPGGARIHLTYRKPAALVEVDSQGFFPVDREGVLLPTAYFLQAGPEVKEQFPRIRSVRSMPLGTVGTPWGDPLVHQAAQLAGLLEEVCEERIVAIIRPGKEEPPQTNAAIRRSDSWILSTPRGTEILWGSFEPEAPENDRKLDRLRELLEIYRSLDDVPISMKPINL